MNPHGPLKAHMALNHARLPGSATPAAVEVVGFEPTPSACKAGALPAELRPLLPDLITWVLTQLGNSTINERFVGFRIFGFPPLNRRNLV